MPDTWLVVVATIMGPVLAVQAQKWLENSRESRRRKQEVFELLMATRAARLSPDHVRALNMIDIVFYGRKMFGKALPTRKEQRVVETWREYLDHLGSPITESNAEVWGASRDELFINLLEAMAHAVSYRVDRVTLKKGAYWPTAHGDYEEEVRQLRFAAIGALTGKTAINMKVVQFPQDAEAVAAYKSTLERLNASLEGGRLAVDMRDHEKG